MHLKMQKDAVMQQQQQQQLWQKHNAVSLGHRKPENLKPQTLKPL